MMRFALVMLAACAGGIDGKGPAPDAPIDDDFDNDGVRAALDCDDGNASVYPGALDVCDEVDQDCDGATDEGAATFEDAAGTRDVSLLFQNHDAANPARISFPTAGKLRLCGTGTYFAAITATANLEIAGKGMTATTLDGGGVARVVTIETQGTLDIHDVTLAHGRSIDGGALYCANATVVMRDAAITASTAERFGGGAALELCTSTFTNVSVTSNAAGVGGGISTLRGATTLTGVTMTSNTASSVGGALTSSGTGATVEVIDSTIAQNSSAIASGGGIYIEGSATCRSSAITTNTGNGVYVVGQGASFTSTTCNFGAGADTNTPADVVPANSQTTANFGAAASFLCSNTACN